MVPSFNWHKILNKTNDYSNQMFVTCLFSLTGIARIEFGQHTGGNTFQHFFGENTQQLPADIKRLEDSTVFVVALCNEILLEFRQEFQIEQVVRCQSFFTNDGLHGLDVFTDGVTRVLESDKFICFWRKRNCIVIINWNKHLFRELTSWLETSEWSLRVMPSPIADFMRRDRDGNTLIGG